ncbi:MAG: hypothetical protein ACI959_002266 [Limisphaerales bacterium]|jgi:hypothetical protein
MLIYFYIIFVPILLISVYRIVYQQKCPSVSDIKASIQYEGYISDTEKDTIIRHIGVCKKCRNKVDDIMNGLEDFADPKILDS